MQTSICNNCSITANSSMISGYNVNTKAMKTRQQCDNCSASAPALASESSSIIIYNNTKELNQQNNNYLIVGLCLGLLGIIYVMALMIYIRSQLHKQRHSDRMCNSSISNQSLNRMENGNSGQSCDSSCGTISPNSVTSCSLSTQSETIIDDIDCNRNECELKKAKANAYSSCFTENTKSIIFDKTQKIVPQERLSKRCLYINPEFFEPELLKLPPPPAIEFLHRIRELISNARGRIRNFRYKPTLLVIPEDDYFYHELNKDTNPENKCVSMMCPPTPPRRVKRSSTPFDSNKQVMNSTKFAPISTCSEMRDKYDNNNKLFDSCQERNVKNCIEEVNEELSSFDNNSNCETNGKTNDINKCKLFIKNDSKDKLCEKQVIFSSTNKISRKELVMKLNDMQCETIDNSDLFNGYQNRNNCLKIINEPNNSISSNNLMNVIDEDTPLDSLKLLSAKVAKKLSETSVPELNYNCLPHNEYNKLQHLMIDFRNSFGKLKAKNNCDFSPIKSCDNWTLQSVRHTKVKMNGHEAESSCTTSDNCTSSEEYSLENKCNHILYGNLSDKNDLKSNGQKPCECDQQNHLETNECNNYSDPKYAYNISNDSIDTNCELNSFPSTNGYECDIGTTDTDSTDEMSTTSSVKANQFNSFESISISSDITEDSLNMETPTDVSHSKNNESDKIVSSNDNGCLLDVNCTEEDDNGIEACLIELANAQIDCDSQTQTKHYLNSDSATNGMSTLYKFNTSKCCNWKHNCAHNHSRHLNEYLSDESVSSSASKNRMSYRGTEDITCFNSHEYRSFGDNDAKLAHNSPINRQKLCSCRMIGYATHQCNTLVNDSRSISDDLCSNSSKPKNKSSKTVNTANHSSYLTNKFSKFLTKTTKNATYSKTHASKQRKQVNRKTNSYIDQIIPNVNNAHRTDTNCEHSLLRKQQPKKKLTNGTCKKYIQQRQQINDSNSQRIANGSPIVRRHQTKHAQNGTDDHKNKHLLRLNDQNVSPNDTVIERNDGLKHHFVTRIPV